MKTVFLLAIFLTLAISTSTPEMNTFEERFEIEHPDVITTPNDDDPTPKFDDLGDMSLELLFRLQKAEDKTIVDMSIADLLRGVDETPTKYEKKLMKKRLKQMKKDFKKEKKEAEKLAKRKAKRKKKLKPKEKKKKNPNGKIKAMLHNNTCPGVCCQEDALEYVCPSINKCHTSCMMKTMMVIEDCIDHCSERIAMCTEDLALMCPRLACAVKCGKEK